MILTKDFCRSSTQKIYPRDVFETVTLTTHVSNTRNTQETPVTTESVYTISNVRMKKLNRQGRVQDPDHDQVSEENVIFQFFKKDLDAAGVATPSQIQVGDYLKRANGDYYLVEDDMGLTEQLMQEVYNLNCVRIKPTA